MINDKNQILMKKFLISLFFLYSCLLSAQQTVNFDLNNGEFSKKLSYIEKISIEGYPVKGNKKIDIIELVITTSNKKIEKEVGEKKLELGQLELEIESLKKLIKDSLPTKDNTKAYAQLVNKMVKLNKDKLKYYTREDSVSNINKRLETTESELTIFKENSLHIHKANIALAEIKKGNLFQQFEDLKAKAEISIEKQKIIWERKTKEEKFTLSLTNTLIMEEDYKFIFNLYTKNSQPYPINVLTKNSVDEITSRLKSSDFVPGKDALDYIREQLDSINTIYFKNKQQYSSEKGFTTYSGEFKKKENLILEFSKLIPFINDVKRKSNRLVLNNTRIQDTLSLTTNGINLLDKEEEKKKFVDLCESFNPDKRQEYFNLLRVNNVDSIKGAELWDLIKILNKQAVVDIITMENNIKIQQERIKNILTTEMEELYVKDYIVDHSMSSASIKTDLDATRIGTVYGIGSINLTDDVWELTQYIALNFRFGPYDNRLKGPAAYKTFWSRCSIMFGISTTNELEYKGQELSNTRLGFKPILGLSFEPIKHLNISGGVIAFVQDPISSDQSYSLTKYRPVVSIAFDFNAVNYLITKNK